MFDYNILKEALISVNIEERFINKMIEKSNFFVYDLKKGSGYIYEFKNNTVFYTFPLYTSFKRIDEMFSVGGVPEKLVERIKPVSINIEFSKNFNIKEVKMTYRYFEETYILQLYYQEKSGNLVKVDKTSQKRSINATHALDQLHSNFGMNKEVCEMIKRNQFINGCFGYFTVSLYDDEFTIKSYHPTESCNIPASVSRLLGKPPVFSSFEFDNDYVCNNVSFIDKKIEVFGKNFYTTHVYINMDINGNLVSYRKEVTDLKKKNDYGEDLIVKSVDIKIAGLAIEEIEAYIKILNEPSTFEEIVPEFFITGPSNIPNFEDRFTLAQMIVC